MVHANRSSNRVSVVAKFDTRLLHDISLCIIVYYYTIGIIIRVLLNCTTCPQALSKNMQVCKLLPEAACVMRYA